MLDKVLEVLNDYYVSEFDSEAVVSKLPEDSILHLAYTTYDFGDGQEKDVQVDFDLKRLVFQNYIDSVLVLEEKRDSIADFLEELLSCSFEDVIRECVYKGFELYG